MRKIENRKDWLEFIAACNRNTVHLAKFGLSQNGDNIDCFFDVYRVLSFGFDFNDVYENMMCSDEGSKKLVEPSKYFDELQTNYSTPFFVTDTGDNFTWL